MIDPIDRQAAIDALYHVDEYNGRSVEAIRNLPSAQPEQRWIPCSERLPEDVLCVTLVTNGMDVWVETWVGIVGKWKYNHSSITAWMPLPEPYEERREEE